MIRIIIVNCKGQHQITEFDNHLGVSSGAGIICGVSGGVMEATLRTSYEWITGEELEKIDFEEVRGLEGIKEAKINIKRKEVNVAVVNSLGNAKKIMDGIRLGKYKYDFIEVMACPGRCSNKIASGKIKFSY